MSGFAILIEGGLGVSGYLLATAGMINSADDIGTNSTGESISHQMVDQDNKEIIGDIKTGVSAITSGRSAIGASETLKSPNKIISGVNDAFNAIRNIYNKDQNEKERN